MGNAGSPHYVRLASDICVFKKSDSGLQLLLIQRRKAPFKGDWALPGGRLEADEDLDQCATRELLEETGLASVFIKHFANFSAPQRDPRERTVSAAYIAQASADAVISAGSDASRVAWVPVSSLPPWAFDHDQIGLSALSPL